LVVVELLSHHELLVSDLVASGIIRRDDSLNCSLRLSHRLLGVCNQQNVLLILVIWLRG
jgi:hypothetical protein